MTRTVSEIATEIQSLWKLSRTHTALPYLLGMLKVKTMKDFTGMITPRDLVTSFLSTSTAFTGPDAVRLKAELKEHVDTVPRVGKSSPGLSMALPTLDLRSAKDKKEQEKQDKKEKENEV